MEGPPQQWRAYVLEDASVSAASPEQWARAALAAMARHGAERLVAEVNQGGDRGSLRRHVSAFNF